MTLYRATADGQIPLTDEEETALLAEWAANEGKVKVPQSVTMRQARLMLSNAGLLDSVNASVQASSKDIQLTWEYAQEVKRNDPYVLSLGASLGLTDAQIDNLFIQAATL